ncbi:hypothetical protein Pmar_PMAR008836 [Perkinsus marinus ATCC 50983]|uniref:U3 small nucleolar RNA-associated protein 15 C-terminal domain-containing protein n=1 Tax=Perkinsus marinus (strain ATCC 50983 / TXsc) TaxID=423536 RepID=C5LGL9_PERM5|nr:hypothetical protein Pmar_PMAR008836 [Perkinsus marinus ATCC 50983]EER04122.1 hypothetical protein Pmar_PMAR008836 [Perkinsus marinus ATCC 50983]|eukprot:XP_002772306.1 hypothetical protein Pmar_PMAR008836 [Perkinsus marinus ATCC 50983]
MTTDPTAQIELTEEEKEAAALKAQQAEEAAAEIVELIIEAGGHILYRHHRDRLAVKYAAKRVAEALLADVDLTFMPVDPGDGMMRKELGSDTLPDDGDTWSCMPVPPPIDSWAKFAVPVRMVNSLENATITQEVADQKVEKSSVVEATKKGEWLLSEEWWFSLWQVHRYPKLLDAVVEGSTPSVMGASVLDELRQRGALTGATRNRTEEECAKIVNYLAKLMGSWDGPRLGSLVASVLDALTATNQKVFANPSDELVKALNHLSTTIGSEVLTEQKIMPCFPEDSSCIAVLSKGEG